MEVVGISEFISDESYYSECKNIFSIRVSMEESGTRVVSLVCDLLEHDIEQFGGVRVFNDSGVDISDDVLKYISQVRSSCDDSDYYVDRSYNNGCYRNILDCLVSDTYDASDCAYTRRNVVKCNKEEFLGMLNMVSIGRYVIILDMTS